MPKHNNRLTTKYSPKRKSSSLNAFITSDAPRAVDCPMDKETSWLRSYRLWMRTHDTEISRSPTCLHPSAEWMSLYGVMCFARSKNGLLIVCWPNLLANYQRKNRNYLTLAADKVIIFRIHFVYLVAIKAVTMPSEIMRFYAFTLLALVQFIHFNILWILTLMYSELK